MDGGGSVVVYGVGAERLGLSYYPSIHHEACGERSRVGGLIERFFRSTPLHEEGGRGFSQAT